MLNFIQPSRRITCFCYLLFKQHHKPARFSSSPLLLVSNTLVKPKLFTTLQPKKTGGSLLILSRLLSKSRKSRESKYNADSDEENESNEENDDFEIINGAEVKTYSLKTLRVDAFLKLVLGCNRKRIEEEFYKRKIGLNEKILKKKSTQVKAGDSIDLILQVAPDNPEFIYVNRVEILEVKSDTDSDNILVKVQKTKSLLIEKYSKDDTWDS